MATTTAKIVSTNGSLPPRAGAATVTHADQPSPSQERARQLEAIAEAVSGLIARQRMAAEQQDRREALRNPFIHPVVIVTGAEPPHRALTRDISNTGIRFLGTKSLLGQRLKVEIGVPDEQAVSFTVRIVWTCEVGDQLYENGGVFLEKVP